LSFFYSIKNVTKNRKIKIKKNNKNNNTFYYFTYYVKERAEEALKIHLRAVVKKLYLGGDLFE
jgi:hypothetical protein